MSEFRTWADVLAARVAEARPMGRMMAMAATTDEAEGVYMAGPLLDRTTDDSPPPCCTRQRIGADMLVWYGGIEADALARVRAALPRLEGVPDEDVYLCDACRGRLRLARVLSPEEMPRAWPLEDERVS